MLVFFEIDEKKKKKSKVKGKSSLKDLFIY